MKVQRRQLLGWPFGAMLLASCGGDAEVQERVLTPEIQRLLEPVNRAVVGALLRYPATDVEFSALFSFVIAAAESSGSNWHQPLIFDHGGGLPFDTARQLRVLKDRTIRFLPLRTGETICVVCSSERRIDKDEVDALFYAVADMLPTIDELFGGGLSTPWLHLELSGSDSIFTSVQGSNVYFRGADFAHPPTVAHELAHVCSSHWFRVAPLFIIEGIADLVQFGLTGRANYSDRFDGGKVSLDIKRNDSSARSRREGGNGFFLLKAVLEAMGPERFWGAVKDARIPQRTNPTALLELLEKAAVDPGAMRALFMASIEGYA